MLYVYKANGEKRKLKYISEYTIKALKNLNTKKDIIAERLPTFRFSDMLFIAKGHNILPLVNNHLYKG